MKLWAKFFENSSLMAFKIKCMPYLLIHNMFLSYLARYLVYKD